MGSSDTAEMPEAPTEFAAVLPVRRNGRGIAGALFFGVPWMLFLLAVTLGVLFVVDPGVLGRALLALVIMLLVTILITGLALASIWYALYTLWGSERLEMNLERATVTRQVLKIPVPAGGRRGFADRVVVLDRAPAGSRPTPYRLELHVGRSKVRFGAGLSMTDAQELGEAAEEFLAATRDDAVRARAGRRGS